MNARGMTLLELVVVLVVLGILAGVAALSAAGNNPAQQSPAAAENVVRDSTIADGMPRTVATPDTGGRMSHVTFLPDGRVVTDGRTPTQPDTSHAPR